MKLLSGEYTGLSIKKVKKDIMSNFVVSKEMMDLYTIIVADKYEGDYNTSAYFILKNNYN